MAWAQRQNDPRRNNFDLLRLLAAAAVLVSHAYPLTGRTEPFDGYIGQSLGGLGVAVFFSISGYLVARSWASEPHLRLFARKRALRIMPGLIACSLVLALVIGPIVTTLAPSSYFTQAGTWLYVLKHSVLYTFAGELPGVFPHAPVAAAVDGSLWTLPIEAFAYVLVAGAGLLLLFKRRRALLPPLMLAALVLLPFAQPVVDSTLGHSSALGDGQLVIYFVVTFAAGAVLYTFSDRIPLRWDAGLVLLVLTALARGSRLYEPVAAVSIPYVTLLLALRTPHVPVARWLGGDLSYGIYIYAFPMQQIAVLLVGRSITIPKMIALAAPATMVCAALSWRLVERPALARKRPRPRVAAIAESVPVPLA